MGHIKEKRIDIYYKNEYVCTTECFKTCKLAIFSFISKPYKPWDYELAERYKPNYYKDYLSGNIDTTKLKARFKK